MNTKCQKSLIFSLRNFNKGVFLVKLDDFKKMNAYFFHILETKFQIMHLYINNINILKS